MADGKREAFWSAAASGARLSQPQHVRQAKSRWNFVRSFVNPGRCGWDTRVPFHFGKAAALPYRYWLRYSLQLSPRSTRKATPLTGSRLPEAEARARATRIRSAAPSVSPKLAGR